MGAVLLRDVTLGDLAAIIRILEQRPVRAINLVLALPLAVAGRWLLPAEVPSGEWADFIRSDLGAVAAGLFLSFAGILAAVGYLLGSMAIVARFQDRIRPRDSLISVATGVVLLAACLFLAGRALSWAGALSMLLMAGGTWWSLSRWLKPLGGIPPADLQPREYDPRRD